MKSPRSSKPVFNHRIATEQDIPEIIRLMQASISENMKAYLSAAEIEAAKETMGVDRTLIEDGTYFVIETIVEQNTVMVGCGGWGKRRTLFGGDHTKGRDDSFSDPSKEAARIRAMYTHPSWTRLGIGSLLLNLGEEAAKESGFKRIQLGSTLPGEPLYLSKGYIEINRFNEESENGSENWVITMEKTL